MNPAYVLHDTSTVYSPALLFYKDIIRRNIACAVEIAGSPARLRPHVKTHKTREIVQMEKEAGITKHKCAHHRRGGDAGPMRRTRRVPGVQPGRAEL